MLRFVANHENVIILGPLGVGKTHIAIGLGMEAIRAGYSAYYANSATMIEKLKRSSVRGTLDGTLRKLSLFSGLRAGCCDTLLAGHRQFILDFFDDNDTHVQDDTPHSELPAWSEPSLETGEERFDPPLLVVLLEEPLWTLGCLSCMCLQAGLPNP